MCTHLNVLQVTLNILDQLPHCLLQTPEQLLLSVEYFISHLRKEELKYIAKILML